MQGRRTVCCNLPTVGETLPFMLTLNSHVQPHKTTAGSKAAPGISPRAYEGACSSTSVLTAAEHLYCRLWTSRQGRMGAQRMCRGRRGRMCRLSMILRPFSWCHTTEKPPDPRCHRCLREVACC